VGKEEISQRINYPPVTETSSHLFSLPAPLFFFFCVCVCVAALGIGYYNLNRALEMKSPPPSPLPLNMGTENLRGDAANQAMAAPRANQSSAVSSRSLFTILLHAYYTHVVGALR